MPSLHTAEGNEGLEAAMCRSQLQNGSLGASLAQLQRSESCRTVDLVAASSSGLQQNQRRLEQVSLRTCRLREAPLSLQPLGWQHHQRILVTLPMLLRRLKDAGVD